MLLQKILLLTVDSAENSASRIGQGLAWVCVCVCVSGFIGAGNPSGNESIHCFFFLHCDSEYRSEEKDFSIGWREM